MNNLNRSTATAICTAYSGGRLGGTATHGLEGDIRRDRRADYVFANPPSNDPDWFRKGDGARWQFGVLSKENANVRLFVGEAEPSLVA